MRGLQSFQIGRQWCSLTTADTVGVDHGRKKATQVVKVSLQIETSTERSATERRAGEEGVNGEEMVSVQFRGNELKVPRGAVLRTALLQHGLSPHSQRAVLINCRGAGTCGTCAVQIEGNVIPPIWGSKETLRLNLPPHGPPQNSILRLACSVQLDGVVKVTKYDKFWGQGNIPLGPIAVSDSVTPLGDVEFLLDFKRKSKNN